MAGYRLGRFGVELDGARLDSIAQRLIDVFKLGIEPIIVVGAGNLLRGQAFSATSQIPRNTADYMGMLATVINACALQETLEKLGQPARVLSAIEVAAICEPFSTRRAAHHIEKERIIVLAGGTGNPFFTTDTCAALRSAELGVDLLIKATKVDGVYSDDPMKNPDAVFQTEISYEEVIGKNLKIMDQSAISLCRENNIPIIVLNIFQESNLIKALCGDKVGTLIS